MKITKDMVREPTEKRTAYMTIPELVTELFDNTNTIGVVYGVVITALAERLNLKFNASIDGTRFDQYLDQIKELYPEHGL